MTSSVDRSRARLSVIAAILALAMLALGCSSDSSGGGSATSAPASTGAVLRVPEDFPTIQAAVDAAKPGDLVLIAPGVYREGVVVQTENIVIRGLDRNEVIIDGEFTRDNGIKVFADGVAVENLTVRNNTGNGLFFTGDYDSDYVLTGYRASYVTAYNNGDYGIYAFNARLGIIEDSYGSGHPDSAFYIGQCNPCDAVIRNVLAENNMLGYSGTNSSTNLYLINSEWRRNMIGVVPNSQDSEKLAPQGHMVIAGNYIHDNNNPGVPINNDTYRLASGTGIVITGGVENLVTKNRVEDNLRGNIVVILWPFRDPGLPPFEAIGNRIIGNIARGATGIGDLVLWLADSSQGVQGNCFADNDFLTSFPADIEKVAPCDAPGGKGLPDIDLDKLTMGPPGVDYKTVPPPPPQPNMPDAATAPARPATDIVIDVDVDAITMPARRGS
ncbi:MAG: hypothetical protein WHS89_00505 [Acidimicrobiales bacterium]|jgi:hypothetical protein